MDQSAAINAGVADKNIHISDDGKRIAHAFGIGNIAANCGSAGGGGNGRCGLVVLFVEEIDLISAGGEGGHDGNADSPGTAGNNTSSHAFYLLRLLVR